MNSFKLATTLFLCACNSLLAQDISEIYRGYLPPTLMANKPFHQAVEHKLNYYAKLNPLLIPIYIKSLELRFARKINNSDSNFVNILKQNEKYFEAKKSEWARRQIREMFSQSSNRQKKDIATYFDEYLVDETSDENLSETVFDNNNQLNYFVYLLLTEKKNSVYRDDLNYADLLDTEQDHLINGFIEVYENARQNTGIDTKRAVRFAIKYSYLFQGTYIPTIQKTTPFELWDFLQKVLYDKYSIQNSISFGIGYNYLPFTLKRNVENFDPFVPRGTILKIEQTHAVDLFVDFRLKLKRSLTSFSTLRFRAGLSVLPRVNKDSILFGTTAAIPNVGRFSGFYALHDNQTINYALTVQVSAPLTYITKALSLETGLEYSFLRFRSKSDVDRNGQLNLVNIQNIPSVLEVNIREHNISPTLSLSYFLSNSLQLQSTVHIPIYSSEASIKRNVNVDIGLGFDFTK